MTEQFDALEAAKSDTPVEIPNEPVEEPKDELQEEASEEAGKLDQAIEEEVEEKKEHSVPLHHLLQERQSKQELQKELDRIKEEFAELKERLNAGPTPEFDDDPKSYVDKSLESVNKGLEKKGYITKQELEERIQSNALQNAIAEDTRAVSQKHPDFQSALDHTRQYFYNQHLLSGVPLEQIGDLIAKTELNICKDFFQKGQSPSEFIYSYAVKNLGYKGKAPSKKEMTSAEIENNQKLENIRKGQESSTPLPSGDAGSSGGGGQGDVFDEAFSEAFSFMKR